MRIAALGRTQLMVDSIVALEQAGHEVVLIATCKASPDCRITEDDFERMAAVRGCAFYRRASLGDESFLRLVDSARAEVAVSVNWINVIGVETLTRFPHGVINGHAGDLPRFRGNACPNWAILHNEQEVVLSVHKMVADLDAGPILLKERFPLTPDTYIGDVYRFIEETLPRMFTAAIDAIAKGERLESPQAEEPAQSLRCFPRLPSDSLLDWERPASELGRIVRASAEPFAGAYSFLDGTKLTVWRARPIEVPYPYLAIPGQVMQIDRASGCVSVLTSHGALLMEEVELGGGRVRPGTVIRSTRQRLGLDLAAAFLDLRGRLAFLEERLGDLTARSARE